MPDPWRPGLPPVGTICDVRRVRHSDVVARNVTIAACDGCTDPACPLRVLRLPDSMVDDGRFGVSVMPRFFEWREIEVPAGL